MARGDGMGYGWRREMRPRRASDPVHAARRCVRWALPVLPILIFGAVCTLAGVFLAQQPPRLFRYTIDEIIVEERFHEVGRIVLVYVGILLAGQSVTALSRFWMTVAGQRLLHTMRTQL